MENHYEDNYHEFVHKNLLNNKLYYKFRADYADKAYWKYFKNVKDGEFLDFGCGMGQHIFNHKGNSLGVDISDFSVKKCNERGINVIKNIKTLKSNSFDGVLSCHCLEHLENPNLAIKEIFRVLKPGGRFVLVLPVDSNNSVSRFESNIAKHLYSWTLQSASELLNHFGFKVVFRKFNYAHGFSVFYKLPFNLALMGLEFLGKLRNKKEMIIVGEK